MASLSPVQFSSLSDMEMILLKKACRMACALCVVPAGGDQYERWQEEFLTSEVVCTSVLLFLHPMLTYRSARLLHC